MAKRKLTGLSSELSVTPFTELAREPDVITDLGKGQHLRIWHGHAEPWRGQGWRIVLPIEAPGYNQQRGMHWGALSRFKATIGNMLASVAASSSITKATGRRRVQIRHYRWAKLDKNDNLGPAEKQIVDAMKRKGGLGWLIDDDEKWAERLPPLQFVDRKNRRVEIYLQEA